MNFTIHIDKKLKYWIAGLFLRPEYGLVINIGQWPMFHSFACKNQDFDGPFEISMDHLENKMGPRNLNIHLLQNKNQI